MLGASGPPDSVFTALFVVFQPLGLSLSPCLSLPSPPTHRTRLTPRVLNVAWSLYSSPPLSPLVFSDLPPLLASTSDTKMHFVGVFAVCLLLFL